jgi:hypothetical protein
LLLGQDSHERVWEAHGGENEYQSPFNIQSEEWENEFEGDLFKDYKKKLHELAGDKPLITRREIMLMA